MLSILKKRKNRIGLVIGISIFCALVLVSTFFVWDIRIECDTNQPYNEILQNLKEVGCYKGKFIPTTDFDKVCVDYLDKFKETAWISVNVKGSIAHVEVIDKDISDKQTDTVPQNIVASYDGIIVSTSAYCGRVEVQDGDIVQKGDLLISGIVNNANETVRLCHASGEVMAIVYTDLSCYIPYNQVQTYKTGKEYEYKYIRFFNLDIPIKNNLPDNCDGYEISRQTNELVLFSSLELPLSIERTVYSQTSEKDTVYSSIQAENAATVQMKQKFEKELKDAQILSITTNGYHGDDGYTLVCSVKCEMNIATECEIIP